jgi:hypothetical protein
MPHDYYPRLELLKRQASEMGLSRDRVREFGSLTRRATWESAIAFHRATNRECNRWNDLELENVDNVIHNPVEPHDTRVSSILSFWQLASLFFLIVGFFVLVVPVLQKVNLFPQIKITIEIGGK